jgi:hypothetical protein
MRKNSFPSAVPLLLQVLDQGYEKKAWHGPNLKQSLKGVTAREAAWRFHQGRHNIWEIALHAAYWKYAVRRRLRGDPRGSFPLKGSNWFRRPTVSSERAWRGDRELLEQEHRKLRQAIAALARGKSRDVRWDMVFGVAFHDVYHAGQIRLLHRLRVASRRRRVHAR